MKMKKKILVIYSGGMDSFTCLHKAIQTGAEVHAVNFNYGQKHSAEILYAAQVCSKLNITLKRVQLEALGDITTSSALTCANKQVPMGHYEDESMKATVVPNRNMTLLSLAASHAITIGASELWYGAHSGDHAIYPDCRPEFVTAMEQVLNVCHYEPLKLVVPFLYGNKETILIEGLAMGLDYSETWTCYAPRTYAPSIGCSAYRTVACGKCGSCTERLEAFKAVGITDPLEYTK